MDEAQLKALLDLYREELRSAREQALREAWLAVREAVSHRHAERAVARLVADEVMKEE